MTLGPLRQGQEVIRAQECDMTAIMRRWAEQYLVSVDSDHDKEWQRQPHFYDRRQKKSLANNE